MRKPIGLTWFRKIIVFFVMVTLFSVTGSIKLYAGDTIPESLVITTVEVEGTILMIFGHNFDIGPQEPEVFLGDVPLPLTEPPTDERITVDLSSFPDTDGYYLLTVSTGPNREENDTHGLLLGTADPEPLWTQLHIQNNQVILDEDNDELKITIFGYNFDLGYWLPTVRLGDAVLTVVESESDETQIIATGSIPDLSQPEYRLLTVETGASLEKYDVVLANLPVETEEPTETPSEGECIEEYDLCWKDGPWKPTWPGVCILVKWKVPKYYELTKDYEIDLADFYKAFLDQSPLIKLPRMAERYDRILNDYFKLMLELPEVPFTQHTEGGFKWDFISIEKRKTGPYEGYPIIKIKKGYRWDGTTRPCRRFDSEFRAGLVHDSMYDLIRIRAIPWKETYTGKKKNKNDRNNLNNRELADMLFYWVSLQDRDKLNLNKPKDPDDAYYTLQHDGMGRANNHIEELARWRFHTLADAEVSAGNSFMDIDAEGNKSLTTSCGSPSTEIELDASFSRPIPRSPIAESHYTLDGLEMHETTWEWNLNGGTVIVPRKQNDVDGPPLDPSDLTATMTVQNMIDKGFVLGGENTVTLYIDKGKNPSNRKTYYEKKEDVTITVNYDSESPVITNVSVTPNTLWPPNSKMVPVEVSITATDICDTAPACSITSIVSSEPDDDTTDSEITGDVTANLRSKRLGTGNGLVYTISVECRDASGNTTAGMTTVTVPHDQGKGKNGNNNGKLKKSETDLVEARSVSDLVGGGTGGAGGCFINSLMP